VRGAYKNYFEISYSLGAYIFNHVRSTTHGGEKRSLRAYIAVCFQIKIHCNLSSFSCRYIVSLFRVLQRHAPDCRDWQG